MTLEEVMDAQNAKRADKRPYLMNDELALARAMWKERPKVMVANRIRKREIQPDSIQERVFNSLSEEPEMTLKDICDKVGILPTQVKTALSNLKTAGRVYNQVFQQPGCDEYRVIKVYRWGRAS